MSQSGKSSESCVPNVEVFESRLQERVRHAKALGILDTTEQWHKDLAEHDCQWWSCRISNWTSPMLKVMLSRDRPPTPQELLDELDPIGDQSKPGWYIDVITPNGNLPVDERAASKFFIYVGSATAQDHGLSGRVKQHSNPKYRERLIKEGHSGGHHRVLQSRSGPKKDGPFLFAPSFRCLGVADFGKFSQAEVLETRLVCVFAEAIYTAWLGAYDPKYASRLAAHIPQTPEWPQNGSRAYLGLCSISPLSQVVDRPGVTETPRGPDHYLKREVIGAQRRRDDAPEEKQKHNKAVTNKRFRRVTKWTRKMRLAGVPESTVVALYAREKEYKALKHKKLGYFGQQAVDTDWARKVAAEKGTTHLIDEADSDSDDGMDDNALYDKKLKQAQEFEQVLAAREASKPQPSKPPAAKSAQSTQPKQVLAEQEASKPKAKKRPAAEPAKPSQPKKPKTIDEFFGPRRS